MTRTPAVPQAMSGWDASPSRSWIESPGFDLAFLILAPLITLPIVFGMLMGFGFLGYLAFFLAFAHYLSTFAFFFWDDNRAHHRARWVAFFAGPAVITVAFWCLVVFQVPLAIPFVLFFWNAYHVSLQSCGISSLYRHRAGVTDPAQKRLANAAIISVSLWLSLWNIETHKEALPVLTFIAPALPRLLRLGLGAFALAAVVRLAAGLRERVARGRGPGVLELAILLTGLTLFHPYLWLRTSEGATFAMLLPHYVQYLGLVWLLHRRKFRLPSGSLPQRCLHVLSTNGILLTAVLLSAGMAFVVGRVLFKSLGHVEYFEAIYLLLAFVHFYLDGLFWAFRDPHVRQSLGPYLVSAPSPSLASVAPAV